MIPSTLSDTLRDSRLTVAVTGAGISAASGIPTFREAQTGLWEKFKPEELATRQAYEANPRQVWDWYQWRRDLIAKAQPNPGHQALVDLETAAKDFQLITQNVDGLHQKAGTKNIIEFHGNIRRDKCLNRNTPLNQVSYGEEKPPRCPCCGGFVRPDVVWFGEAIDTDHLNQAFEVAQRCDVFLSIGTSSQVYPAAGLVELAIESDATTIEINPSRTPISGMVDYFLEGEADKILPAIAKAL